MNKYKAFLHIEKHLIQGDELIDVFQAIEPPKIWAFFIVGPLAVLTMRVNMIGLSTRGVYIHRLSTMGAFTDFDFFDYEEIEHLKVKRGWMQKPLIFTFFNKRQLKVKAQLKGIKKVAKLSNEMMDLLSRKVEILQ